MQSVRRILRGNYGFAFKKEIQLTNNKPESVNASTDNHIAVRGKGQVMVVLEELQEQMVALKALVGKFLVMPHLNFLMKNLRQD